MRDSNRMTKKDLLYAIEDMPDDAIINVEYRGCDIDLNRGDTFYADDINMTDKHIYIEFR